MIPAFYLYLSLTTIAFIFLGTCSFAQRSKTSRQVDALMLEKNSRTAAQRKIDSQLLQAIREYSGKKLEGTNLEPANVNADKSGDLMVDISASVSDELLGKIEALGGKIIFPSKQYSTIRAQVHITSVETIAAFESVKFIRAAVLPMHGSAAPGAAMKGSIVKPAVPAPVKQVSDSLH